MAALVEVVVLAIVNMLVYMSLSIMFMACSCLSES
jgi:hypothetical protein